MKSTLFYLALFLFVCESIFAQEMDFTNEDTTIFNRYISYIKPYRETSKDTVLEKTALFFLDTPYETATLEKNETEKLVVNLRALDCVTFVENVMALTKTVLAGDTLFQDFTANLQNIRYRNGIVNGYDSRLHYTSDWAFDNVSKENLQPLTENFGGILEKKTILFMSSNPNLYRQLENDKGMIFKIRKTENSINSRGGFYYIPQNRISKIENRIPHLAVIAFTTSVKGLDTSHIGFTFRHKNKLYFIHASSNKKKVIIDKRTVSEYCSIQKSCTGIILYKVM